MTDVIATTAEAAENAVLRRSGVAHCDPSVETCEEKPLPEAIARKPAEQKSPAEWAYERVILYIQNFEKQLDADHEVGMGFVGGDAGTMHVQGVGFFAPDLITFYGVDGAGAKTQLVQHVSQLSVMLKAAPKIRETAARIGFDLAAQLAADAAGGEGAAVEGGD
ncbi:MAG: DUF6173 family protein [Pseudomonadota bacterium]